MSNKKTILWIIVIIALILLILFSFNIIKFGSTSSGKSDYGSQNYQNIPQECRPPAGQDIESWKEHLSHHTETQSCLKYFK